MTDILDCSTEQMSKQGVRMPLLHPATEEVLTHQAKGDKQPREMYLVLLGPESEVTRRALAQMQNRANKKKDNQDMSDAAIEAERQSDSRMLAKLTIGGLVFMKGEWLDVTTDNAYEVYHAVMPFRGQAMKFLIDVGNFIKG